MGDSDDEGADFVKYGVFLEPDAKYSADLEGPHEQDSPEFKEEFPGLFDDIVGSSPLDSDMRPGPDSDIIDEVNSSNSLQLISSPSNS